MTALASSRTTWTVSGPARGSGGGAGGHGGRSQSSPIAASCSRILRRSQTQTVLPEQAAASSPPSGLKQSQVTISAWGSTSVAYSRPLAGSSNRTGLTDGLEEVATAIILPSRVNASGASTPPGCSRGTVPAPRQD